MTRSGKTFVILGILWKVFLVVIIMHLICIAVQFCIAGVIGHKNPLALIKNQIPGYTTALGTQSSAATIPVNLQCAEADASRRDPQLCRAAVREHPHGRLHDHHHCLRNRSLPDEPDPDQPCHGRALHCNAWRGDGCLAGAPGGSIMTALPFLYMIFGAELGDPEGPLCAIMVALYITQDSFGTACNVSGDNAIGVIVDTIYKKWIKK